MTDKWSNAGFPAVQFITYAYDDPDDAPVLDVSHSIEGSRHWMQGRSGFVYRVERLPESEWTNPTTPTYGNDQFVEFIEHGKKKEPQQ